MLGIQLWHKQSFNDKSLHHHQELSITETYDTLPRRRFSRKSIFLSETKQNPGSSRFVLLFFLSSRRHFSDASHKNFVIKIDASWGRRGVKNTNLIFIFYRQTVAVAVSGKKFINRGHTQRETERVEKNMVRNDMTGRASGSWNIEIFSDWKRLRRKEREIQFKVFPSEKQFLNFSRGFFFRKRFSQKILLKSLIFSWENKGNGKLPSGGEHSTKRRSLLDMFNITCRSRNGSGRKKKHLPSIYDETGERRNKFSLKWIARCSLTNTFLLHLFFGTFSTHIKRQSKSQHHAAAGEKGKGAWWAKQI